MAAIGSLRRLGASVLALGRIRLELFSIELQEEKQRIASLAFWAVLSALAAGFAGVFLAVTATVWLWDTHRLLVLVLASVAWVALALFGVQRVKGLAAGGSTLFQASLGELRRDEAALRASPPPAAPPVASPAASDRPEPRGRTGAD